MGTEFRFVCQTHNKIYDIGKWENATKLLPYLKEQHKYCDCGTCAEYDLQHAYGNKGLNNWEIKDGCYIAKIKCGEAGTPHYAAFNLALNHPTFVNHKTAGFWDSFRTWVETRKSNAYKDLRLRIKMALGLQYDWWKDDEKIDREIQTRMKKLEHFLVKVEELDEGIIDKIIDDVVTSCHSTTENGKDD